MFLFFIKPKGRKHSETIDYINASAIHSPFLYFKAVNIIAWFVCIPFLIFAYSETIEAFIIITFCGFLTDFLAKLTDPNYYYF